MRNRFEAGVTQEAIEIVSRDMRDDDRNEIWASDHFNPFEAITQGVERSTMLWTVIIEDKPAAVGGVAPLPTDVHPNGGVCWMLGTDRIRLAPEWFLLESKIILGAMLIKYGFLTNFVDERNVVCLNWLRWLGFKVLPPAPYGAEQLLFRQVIREV